MSDSHHISDRPAYFAHWGKARPDDHADNDGFHQLAFHSLDVAAVGQVLLRRHPRLAQELAAPMGLPQEVFAAWMVYFLALHDVGKFGQGFQAQVPELFQRLQCIEASKTYRTRHDSFGYALWCKRLRDEFNTGDPFLLGEDLEDLLPAFTLWMGCVAGHHGRPPGSLPNALDDEATRADIAAAVEFMRALDFLVRDVDRVTLDPEQFEDAMPAVSWWLAGVAVLCDWLGSNQSYFAYRSGPVDSLETYWVEALKQAEIAVNQAGFLPVASGPLRGLDSFLPPGATPTDLQQTAESFAVRDQPQLFILEDLTGSGKTEAAAVLAHRMMHYGAADGLFFALPTMATANAMFERIQQIHPLLFSEIEKASLILAHSQRRLMNNFTESVLVPGESQGAIPPESPLPDTGETTASARCAAWLADNSKKALLASVGVGTIDQSLMAILHSRHQSMRLLGLFRKVLIVDEVHANDAYVHRLLCALLRFHAAAGGSAVLLSATLPRRMRAQLLEAFAEGRNHLDLPPVQDNRYPLLTYCCEGGLVTSPITASERASRSVRTQLVSSEEEVISRILLAAEAGHCVCWIRNTVGDATAAYEELAETLGEHVELFHARFMMGDRLDIERRVLERFGKASTTEQRRGRVLIATQVVEQSLDLDFDVMFSDLAPVDLLIQRVGRLHRHARDVNGNRLTDGPDQRPPPCLQILSPSPDDDADGKWIRRLLPGTGAVYPDHAVLWRTARLMQDRGEIRMPEAARELIEGVHGDEPLQASEALQQIALTAAGQNSADSSVARYNMLTFAEGYIPNQQRWYEESSAPTRLGDPTTTLCLLAWDGEQLRPLYDGDSDFPWQMSQVSVRSALVEAAVEPNDAPSREALAALQAAHPNLFRWVQPVLMRRADVNWLGEASSQAGDRVTLKYSPISGLRIEQC